MNRSLEALVGVTVQFTVAYTGSQDGGFTGYVEKVDHMVWRVVGVGNSQSFTTMQVAEIRIRASEMPEIYVEQS